MPKEWKTDVGVGLCCVLLQLYVHTARSRLELPIDVLIGTVPLRQSLQSLPAPQLPTVVTRQPPSAPQPDDVDIRTSCLCCLLCSNTCMSLCLRVWTHKPNFEATITTCSCEQWKPGVDATWWHIRYDTIQRLHSKTDRTCQFSPARKNWKFMKNEKQKKKTMTMRLIDQETNQ